MTHIGGYAVIWRPLTDRETVIVEYLWGLSALDKSEVEDLIFSLCVLDEGLTVDINRLNAGIVTTVVAGIQYISGFQIDNNVSLAGQMQQLALAKFNSSFIEQRKLEICKVFPGYTFDELDKLDRYNIMKLATYAVLAVKPDAFNPNPVPKNLTPAQAAAMKRLQAAKHKYGPPTNN